MVSYTPLGIFFVVHYKFKQLPGITYFRVKIFALIILDPDPVNRDRL